MVLESVSNYIIQTEIPNSFLSRVNLIQVSIVYKARNSNQMFVDVWCPYYATKSVAQLCHYGPSDSVQFDANSCCNSSSITFHVNWQPYSTLFMQKSNELIVHRQETSEALCLKEILQKRAKNGGIFVYIEPHSLTFFFSIDGGQKLDLFDLAKRTHSRACIQRSFFLFL